MAAVFFYLPITRNSAIMNKKSSARMNMRSMISRNSIIVKDSVINFYLITSHFISLMSGEKTSLASKILVHIIMMFFFIFMLSVEQYPLLAVASAMIAGYLVMILDSRKEASHE